MDFSKTKLHQRTRSGYERLYKEYNQKKVNGKDRNDGSAGDGDGGLVNESDGVRVTARVRGEVVKDRNSRKVSEGLSGSNGGRNDVDSVSRRTRQALSKRGNSLSQVHLVDELENNIDSGIEEVTESENIEEMVQGEKSRNRVKKVSQSSPVDQLDDDDGVELNKSRGKKKKGNKSSRTKDSQQNSGADDALSYLGDSCKSSTGFGNAEIELEAGVLNNNNATTALNDDSLKGAKDSSLSSRGFPLSPGFRLDESDDDDDGDGDGIMFLGNDPTCLDDYDPSHSSRVESNEVKVSPVELDSVQADADADAKLQGPKSSEEEDDDGPQKVVSPEEEGSDWRDINPIGNDAATGDKEVICLSSSSDREDDEKDGNAMDDDGSSVLEVENNDALGDKFWTELCKNHTSDAVHDDSEPRIFNPKPVYEPKKKTGKVNIIEPVVSKKQKRCGNDNETCKPIEGGLKKRRTDADSLRGFGKNNNKGGEDTFWQIVDEKGPLKDGPLKAGKNTSKNFDQFGDKINVMEILKNAIRDEGGGDNLFKKYVDIPPEDIPEEKTPVDQILSYKFKFEDEDDIKPEKLECEIEMDELFDEMNMCLQLSEIGSSDASRIKRGDVDFLVVGTDQAACCRQGKHELTINDQFGIICRYCSYVEMEIRDILPPLSKNGRGGHGRHGYDRTANMKFSDLKLADCHQERHHDSTTGDYEKGTVWDLVPGVKESMYPHQREGFEFIWNKIAGGTYIDKLEKRLPTGGSGCIISHAPGTGKSRLTIVFLQAFLKMYPNSRPLIIAPRSMLLTWEEEFKKWNADFPFFNLNNTECSGHEHKAAASVLKKYGSLKSSRGLRYLKLFSWKETSSVLGITYRLFESLAGDEGKRKQAGNSRDDEDMKNFLLKVPTLLVLDEGHTPRNDQSYMWKTLLNVKTKRSIILSGTPFQNNFDELYNTLCLVNPLLSFGVSSSNTVEVTKKRGWKHNSAKGQWDSLAGSVKNSQHKLQELRAMIDPFVHVHKGTILQERLPGLRDALVVLKPTKTQQTLLGKMDRSKPTLEIHHLMSLVSVHPSLLPKRSGIEGFRKILKMFKSDHRAGVKTNFLMELIQLCVAHNEKVLVFSQYLKPLELIMELLKTNFRWVEGRECLYMDGQREAKQRQSSINTLNDPKSEVRVLLASIKACSEGINLVGASRVVLLDVHWNPSVERQAISRAYRLGQKKLVYVYHLVTGSMESEKYIRQVEKSQLSELVFSSKNKDSSNPKVSSTVSKDKILEEMMEHDQLQHMFEKVIYQPKEADLINSFG